MKKLILLAILAFTIGSCKSKKMIVPVDYTNYEVSALEGGSQGTVVIQVYSYGNSKQNAIEKAKMDAVHAVLFKGIPGSNFTKPMVKDGQESNKEYFEKFFGLYSVKYRNEDKVNPLESSKVFNAPFKLYVQLSNEENNYRSDIQRVGDKYKAKVGVIVNHQELRKRMEQDGIIKSLNSGF